MSKYLFWSKRIYVLILFLALMNASLEAGLALVIEHLVDYIASETFAVSHFVLLGAGALAYASLMIGCYFGYNSLVAWYLNISIKKLSDDLFRSFVEKNYAEYHKEGTATYYSALTNDTQNVANNYLGPLLTLPGYLFTYFAALCVSLFINWKIALFLLAFSFLVFLVPHLFNGRLNRRNEEVQKSFSELSGSYETFLRGQGVIRSASAYEYAYKKEGDASLSAYVSSFRKTRLAYGVSSLSNFMTTSLQITVIVGSGLLAASGGLAIGAVLAFVQLANNLYSPLTLFVSSISSIRGMKGVNERLLSFLISPKKMEDDVELKGDLVLADLGFSYDEKTIFSGLDFVFKEKGKYLICGESGSGKSTLLRLLSCSGEPYTGSIRLGGIDFKNLSFKTICRHLYYCEQTSIVFPGTLRENIVFGEKEDEERLRQAISMSGLGRFAAERGIDTILNPELNSSSGGETQRIALARAIYRNPKILLLDEITSGLDKKNNALILEAIFRLPMTVILVSHNLPSALEKQLDGRINL